MTTPTSPVRVAVVTPAQKRVLLEFMRDGASNIVIGERLGLAPATVASHMGTLMTASGASGRVSMALLFERRQVTLRVVDRTSGPRTE